MVWTSDWQFNAVAFIVCLAIDDWLYRELKGKKEEPEY
jgi:hypothetical protein